MGVPEWHFEQNFYAYFEDGAEIWEVFNDGTEKLRAIYVKRLKKFIKK